MGIFAEIPGKVAGAIHKLSISLLDKSLLQDIPDDDVDMRVLAVKERMGHGIVIVLDYLLIGSSVSL